MTTSKNDIRGWLEEGLKQGCTHVIVACDTFNYDDYPVFVKASENVRERIKEYDGVNMQKVMEVYSLSLDIESQLSEHRAYHVGDSDAEAEQLGATILKGLKRT